MGRSRPCAQLSGERAAGSSPGFWVPQRRWARTTLIRTLLGLISIDAGSGSVLGLDIHAQRLAIRQAVGFAPEDECLFPGLVGIDFVAYAGEACAA